jgi:hypothetical protein
MHPCALLKPVPMTSSDSQTRIERTKYFKLSSSGAAAPPPLNASGRGLASVEARGVDNRV